MSFAVGSVTLISVVCVIIMKEAGQAWMIPTRSWMAVCWVEKASQLLLIPTLVQYTLGFVLVMNFSISSVKPVTVSTTITLFGFAKLSFHFDKVSLVQMRGCFVVLGGGFHVYEGIGILNEYP